MTEAEQVKKQRLDPLYRFVTGLSWKDAPEEVKYQAKLCVQDLIGVMIAGLNTPVSQIDAHTAAEVYGSPGQAVMYYNGTSSSPAGAALANSFAANALDMDDGHRLVKGHPGAIVVPAALQP
jgi:2-methylcitrate dehydratase PrpD